MIILLNPSKYSNASCIFLLVYIYFFCHLIDYIKTGKMQSNTHKPTRNTFFPEPQEAKIEIFPES